MRPQCSLAAGKTTHSANRPGTDQAQHAVDVTAIVPKQLPHRCNCLSAVARALAAHFRTKSAMLVVVPFAFLGTQTTYTGTGFEHDFQAFDILPRPSDRQAGRRGADVGAIETGPDALGHRHRFRAARIGARCADQCAVHGMSRRVRQRHVGVAPDIGMQRNHLVN